MVSEAEMIMTLFAWGRHGGFHKQPPVCTSQVSWAPRGARQGNRGTTGPGRGLATGAMQPVRGSCGSAGSPAPHLSLLHRWAPLVMVKPPVSSCCTCMARRRAEGSVGCARKRRPSIRHRLSLFRKTWGPSWGCGQGETGEGSVWGARLRQPRLARGQPLQGGDSPDAHPVHAVPRRMGSGLDIRTSAAGRYQGNVDAHEKATHFPPSEMANLFPNLLSLGSRK